MRVATKRWGEVSIKKQGESKNKFDKTKSFSVEQSGHEYGIEHYCEILKLATDLTNHYKHSELKSILSKHLK